MGNNLNEATEHAKSKNTELMIRKLKHNENQPMDLLLLADPSEKALRSTLIKVKCT